MVQGFASGIPHAVKVFVLALELSAHEEERAGREAGASLSVGVNEQRPVSRGGPHSGEVGGERGLSRAAPFCEQSDDHGFPLLLRSVKTRSACIIYHVVIRHGACFMVVFSTNVRLPELRDAGVDGPPAGSFLSRNDNALYPRETGGWNGRGEMGRVAETEDAPDLKLGDPMGHVGSTPTAATTFPTEMGRGIQRFVLL